MLWLFSFLINPAYLASRTPQVISGQTRYERTGGCTKRDRQLRCGADEMISQSHRAGMARGRMASWDDLGLHWREGGVRTECVLAPPSLSLSLPSVALMKNKAALWAGETRPPLLAAPFTCRSPPSRPHNILILSPSLLFPSHPIPPLAIISPRPNLGITSSPLQLTLPSLRKCH